MHTFYDPRIELAMVLLMSLKTKKKSAWIWHHKSAVTTRVHPCHKSIKNEVIYSRLSSRWISCFAFSKSHLWTDYPLENLRAAPPLKCQKTPHGASVVYLNNIIILGHQDQEGLKAGRQQLVLCCCRPCFLRQNFLDNMVTCRHDRYAFLLSGTVGKTVLSTSH